jgi:hypothetical protein
LYLSICQGKDDILQGLFTTFAPHNRELGYTIISQEKRVVTRSWNQNQFFQSRAQGYRILKILVDGDDNKIWCFGTRDANNELKLLSFPPATAAEDVRVNKIDKISAMTHQSKFAASLCSLELPHPLPNLRVLVADMTDRTIRIHALPLG